jgi:hypothetical protein
VEAALRDRGVTYVIVPSPAPIRHLRPSTRPISAASTRGASCYAALMEADAYSGFNRLYRASRKDGPIIEASCRVGGDLSFPPLTDPDERITRIRFFTRKLRSRRHIGGRSWLTVTGVERA